MQNGLALKSAFEKRINLFRTFGCFEICALRRKFIFQVMPFRGMGKYRFFSFAGLFRFKITIRQSQIRVTAFPPIFRLMLLHDIECVLNFLSGSKTKIVCQKLFCVNFSLRQKCALLSRPVHNSFFGGS